MQIHKDKGFSVHVLATGSKGNATLVAYKDTLLLIDAGISAKRIKEGVKALGYCMEQLEGILITHEHSDHIAGLPQMLKQYDLPVYTKKKTWQAMYDKIDKYENKLMPLTRHILDIGQISIEAFDIFHDAANPVGFSCYGGSQKVSFVTDTGQVDELMLGHIEESTMLVLEANHDLDMLRYGSYTPQLKRRVAGTYGHLNNVDTARALVMMKRSPEMQVVLAHRSEQNNTEEKVDLAMKQILGQAGLLIGTDIILKQGQQKSCISMEER